MQVFNCGLSLSVTVLAHTSVLFCVNSHMRSYVRACPHTPSNSLTDNPKKTLSFTPNCSTWSPADWKHSAVPKWSEESTHFLYTSLVWILWFHTDITSVFHPFPSPPDLCFPSLPHWNFKFFTINLKFFTVLSWTVGQLWQLIVSVGIENLLYRVSKSRFDYGVL
jgi:hypothetical protein